MPKQIRVTNVTCFGAKDKKGCDERTSQPPYYINRRILDRHQSVWKSAGVVCL